MFFDTYQRNIGSQTHTVHMTSGGTIIQSIQNLKYENNLGIDIPTNLTLNRGACFKNRNRK